MIKKNKWIDYAACVRNISKDFSVEDMKQTGLRGYVDEFLAEYGSIDSNDILDIHKYLMKNNNIK